MAADPTAVTNAPDSLAQDPAYLAFTAQLSKSQGDLEAQAATQTAAINKAMQDRLPAMATNEQHAQDRIGGQMEARGLYSSGQLDQGLADEAQQAGYRYSDLANSTSDRIAAINDALAQRVTNLYATQPAQALAAGQRLQNAQAQDQIAAAAVAPIVGHAAAPLILPVAPPVAPAPPAPAKVLAAQQVQNRPRTANAGAGSGL